MLCFLLAITIEVDSRRFKGCEPMTNNIFFEIQQYLARESQGMRKYTRKAYLMLPKLNRPRILDVGCGFGVPTLELAKLSQGEVRGIDTNQASLNELNKKAGELGLSERVKVTNCSMFEMDFPGESFDIIWAECSIFVIGFERALNEWRRFLKPRGYLVVHHFAWLQPNPSKEVRNYWKQFFPDMRTVQEYTEQIPGCGYDLIGHFSLPEEAWWIEYYGPLAECIKELRAEYVDDPEAIVVLDKAQREIDIYKKSCRWFGSAFLVMQKK